MQQQQKPAVVDLTGAQFQTYCPQATDNCVQYARVDGMVALRSTQTPDNVALFTEAEWDDLLHGARTGEIA